MTEVIQAPEKASAETQEILKELESEGNEIAGKTEAPKETPPAPAPEKKEEPAKPEEKKPEADPVKPGTEKVPARTSKFVPVGIHNEERHKRQEAERRAEEAERRAKALEDKHRENPDKPNTETKISLDERAAKIAEKHGIDIELAKDLIAESTPSNPTLPPELQEDIKVIKDLRAKEEAKALERAQETGFEQEFAEVIKEFPDLVSSKEDLKQLAFLEGNEKTSLRRLALEFQHDNPAGRKTAEAPLAGKKDGGEVIDFANITEEEYSKLTDKQLDQYDEWRAKNKR